MLDLVHLFRRVVRGVHPRVDPAAAQKFRHFPGQRRTGICVFLFDQRPQIGRQIIEEKSIAIITEPFRSEGSTKRRFPPAFSGCAANSPFRREKSTRPARWVPARRCPNPQWTIFPRHTCSFPPASPWVRQKPDASPWQRVENCFRRWAYPESRGSNRPQQRLYFFRHPGILAQSGVFRKHPRAKILSRQRKRFRRQPIDPGQQAVQRLRRAILLAIAPEGNSKTATTPFLKWANSQPSSVLCTLGTKSIPCAVRKSTAARLTR